MNNKLLAVLVLLGALYFVTRAPHAKAKAGQRYYAAYTTKAPTYMTVQDVDPVKQQIRIAWADGTPGGWISFAVYDGLFAIVPMTPVS